jgi:ABC-type methionine transport system ATPase subunit
LKKILILILISLSIVGKSQKFGDSIVFTTYSGKHYNGTIEEVDQDGYFFKTQHSRSIYLSKGEIKEYQTIKNNRNEPVQQKIKEFQDLNNKKEIPKEIIENPTTETRVIAYSKSQLSLLTGIDNLNIILHDGRRIVGTIEKIKYKGIEGLGDAMISISGENQNYNIKKTEIVSLYKNVAVIIPKKKIK